MTSISALIAGFVDDVTTMVEPMRRGRKRRPPVTLVERGGGYECYRNDRRGPTLIASGDLSEFGRKKLPRDMRSQPVEVRLDGSRVLSKTLQLPAASRDYLDAIVTNQLERTTPWAADRVVFDYAVGEGEAASKDHIAVRLVATSRDVFDATMGRLAAAGIKPALIGTSEDPLDHASAVNLLHTTRAERRKTLRRRVRLGLAAILVFGIGASGLAGWRYFTVNAEAAAMDADVIATRHAIESAIARTQSSEGYGKLLAQKSAAVPMVVLLDQVSKTIPASTYLTQLEVQGQELRLIGFSSEAPALIGLLEQTDLLSGVHFAAATTRNEGSPLDRFEIVADIVPPSAGQPSPQPPGGTPSPRSESSSSAAPPRQTEAAATPHAESNSSAAPPSRGDAGLSEAAKASFSDPGVAEQ